MNDQLRTARNVEAQNAQRLTVDEAAEMLRDESTSIKDGLEIVGAVESSSRFAYRPLRPR